jgi:phosphoribosyl 1,2-cyclic phosphodiesterase
MTGRFTVLASGSAGNAALVQINGFGFLVDCGLHPRTLTSRLREAGVCWDAVNAVILTHIHGDHWKNATLAGLCGSRIPLYAHRDHLEYLSTSAMAYAALRRARLLREYATDRPLELAAGLAVRPLQVSHDAEPTFAFRIDWTDSTGLGWSIGYVSDLGCGSSELIDHLAGVDVLALEFNHDVPMERRSRRPKFLIDRVLSDSGHLSNEQAGELAATIVERSGHRPPAHLVQLHLSRECNRPELAAKAGREALAGLNGLVGLTTTSQHAASRTITVTGRSGTGSRRRVETGAETRFDDRANPARASRLPVTLG